MKMNVLLLINPHRLCEIVSSCRAADVNFNLLHTRSRTALCLPLSLNINNKFKIYIFCARVYSKCVKELLTVDWMRECESMFRPCEWVHALVSPNEPQRVRMKVLRRICTVSVERIRCRHRTTRSMRGHLVDSFAKNKYVQWTTYKSDYISSDHICHRLRFFRYVFVYLYSCNTLLAPSSGRCRCW